MVNGAPHGHFTPIEDPTKGSLSPYLFLLCVEGLHSLIQQANDSGSLHGVSLCRAGHKVSHFFFVDDSCFFVKHHNMIATQSWKLYYFMIQPWVNK